jgi:phage baseplate assembly protein W
VSVRHDYAHPFRLDAGSQQVARAGYADHVDQLIRQLLLTSPGERICLPEFGCGLRQLVFAPQSDALVATVRIQVRQAIDRWLSSQVQLTDVEVVSGATAGPASGLDQGELLITVSYVLVETLTPRQVDLKVG